MFFRLILLFTFIPIIELALLIYISPIIGWPRTIILVLLTGFVGAWLARIEGLRTLRQIQDELSHGRMPAEALVQGAMILVAGALLVTPGILTDAFGLCLLIPPVRQFFARYLIHYLRSRINVTYKGPGGPERRRHVDATATTVDDDTDE